MRANFIPALAIGILVLCLFRWSYLRYASIAVRIMLILAAAIFGIPAVLFVSNYLLYVPYNDWFVELHALPGAEITAGFASGMLGIIFASEKLRPAKLNIPIIILCSIFSIILVTAPFIKQLYGSVNYTTLKNSWSDGICLQTSGYTCVPACVATVIRFQGGHITEPELARCAGTTSTGTESWYIKRALRKRGYDLRFHKAKSVREVPANSIVGVTYTGIGHVVVLLRKTAQGVVIGEPLRGRRSYTWRVFQRNYHPDGVYFTIKRLSNL